MSAGPPADAGGATETWRLIQTYGTSPGFNMALDEALLLSSFAPPTLRLYTWSPPALSLGYFQRYEDVPAAGEAPAVVRRLTGGGAIHHDRELTFSITASEEHPLYAGPLPASYDRVHAAISAALARFGVEATPRGQGPPLASDATGTGMCFHGSTAQDLVWNDRKGVGSAQRRKGGRVLHHGSIKLGTTPLEGDIGVVGADVEPRAVGAALVEELAERLGVRFETSVPDRGERLAAADSEEFFVSEEWVRREVRGGER